MYHIETYYIQNAILYITILCKIQFIVRVSFPGICSSRSAAEQKIHYHPRSTRGCLRLRPVCQRLSSLI